MAMKCARALRIYTGNDQMKPRTNMRIVPNAAGPCLLALLVVASAFAADPALTVDGIPSFIVASRTTQTLGWEFTASSPMLVTSLGSSAGGGGIFNGGRLHHHSEPRARRVSFHCESFREIVLALQRILCATKTIGSSGCRLS